MTHHKPLHAYRLGSSDSPHTPEMLWEWEEPYIHCLHWTAKTFGHPIVHCLFLHWTALAAANQRIWETSYVPRALFAPWANWQAWLTEYRTLVTTVQDVYAAQYGRQPDAP